MRKIDLPIVLVTDQGDEEIAAQVLRLGVSDYLVKNPGYLSQLPGILENAYHRAQLQHEQAALRESEERYRRLAENALDIIFRYRLSPMFAIDYVNPAVTRTCGYTQDEFYQQPDLGLKIIHPEDRATMEALLWSAPQKTRIWCYVGYVKTGRSSGWSCVSRPSMMRVETWLPWRVSPGISPRGSKPKNRFNARSSA